MRVRLRRARRGRICVIADRGDRAHDSRRPDDGDRHGHGRPGRPVDDVVRRVRDLHVVRFEDDCEERGIRLERGRRLRRPDGAAVRHDLPLSRRRDERRRHEPRNRCSVHDDGAARRHHRLRFEHQRVCGHAERDGRCERPRHDLLLRVRHVHELWIEDHAEERRLGDLRGAGVDRHLRPGHRPHLPLPHRRLERRRYEHRQGLLLHDERRADGGHR